MKVYEKIIISVYSIILLISVIVGSVFWYKYTAAKSELDRLGRISEQYRTELESTRQSLVSTEEDNRKSAEITEELTELNKRNIKSISDARLTLSEIREQVTLLEKVYNNSSSD